MQYVFMALAAAGIVAADQLSKLWIANNIHLYEDVQAIPGLFHLTFVKNYGAAFSMLQGMQWLFALIFLAFTVLLVMEFKKKTMHLTAFENWCIVLVWAGGLGNMIDRVRLGYVVDMICLDFMNFPVFNVADCFITCGCVALILHLVFFNRAFWKDGKK